MAAHRRFLGLGCLPFAHYVLSFPFGLIFPFSCLSLVSNFSPLGFMESESSTGHVSALLKKEKKWDRDASKRLSFGPSVRVQGKSASQKSAGRGGMGGNGGRTSIC